MLKAPSLFARGRPSSRSTLGFPPLRDTIESLAAVLLSLSESRSSSKTATPHL